MPSLSLTSPKFIYTFDAVVCVVVSVGLLAGSATLAHLVGLPEAATLVIAVGVFLLPWGLFNYAIGTAPISARSSVLLNIVGDGSWLALSVVVLAMHWNVINALGQFLLVGQTLFVAVVLTTKLRGARALLAP